MKKKAAKAVRAYYAEGTRIRGALYDARLAYEEAREEEEAARALVKALERELKEHQSVWTP